MIRRSYEEIEDELDHLIVLQQKKAPFINPSGVSVSPDLYATPLVKWFGWPNPPQDQPLKGGTIVARVSSDTRVIISGFLACKLVTRLLSHSSLFLTH
jgi:hypothetical protein